MQQSLSPDNQKLSKGILSPNQVKDAMVKQQENLFNSKRQSY
jgi:hypothetical protein